MNEQLSLIQRFRKTVIGEYAEALIWAVALALVLTTFVVQAFKIPSGSMLETLQIGDHLLVNKFLYGLRNPFNDDYLIRGVEPKVGDIIVFRTPRIGASTTSSALWAFPATRWRCGTRYCTATALKCRSRTRSIRSRSS